MRHRRWDFSEGAIARLARIVALGLGEVLVQDPAEDVGVGETPEAQHVDVDALVVGEVPETEVGTGAEGTVDQDPRVRAQHPLHVRKAPRDGFAELPLEPFEDCVGGELVRDAPEHRIGRRWNDMVDGDRRRTQGQHFQQTVEESTARLRSDAVDQVEVDLVVPQLVGRLNRAAQLVEPLRGAIDRPERLAAPRLHAATQPVEAEGPDQRQGVRPQSWGETRTSVGCRARR